MVGAMRMCSRAWGCLNTMTRIPASGFLWVLFDSLSGSDAAGRVLQLCPRMRDDFSQYWLAQYPTPEALGGEVRRSCLVTLGTEVRDSTHRVEVRHGQFQREMTEKSLHVTPTNFDLVSALFSCSENVGLHMSIRLLWHKGVRRLKAP